MKTTKVAGLLVVLIAGCGVVATAPAPSGVAIASSSAGPAAPANATDATIAGCVPECLPRTGAAVRPIPAGAFSTTYFFSRAFTINLDAGWTVEDGSNELAFEHPGPPDWFIFAWLDPFPISHLRRVEGVARTPDALIAWLMANPTLTATRAASASVAGGLPAAVVDLRVSDKAILESPDCPDVCTNYLGFEEPGPASHGIARPGVTRIWFAPVTYGGETHLLTISFETLDEATFTAERAHAQQLVDSISMPVAAAP